MNMNAFLPLLQYVETGTFVLLGFLSIWSLGVMIDRRRVYKKTFPIGDFIQAEQFLKKGEAQKAKEWAASNDGIVPQLLRSLIDVPAQTPETVDAAARSFLQSQRHALERGLNVLATLGSNAPFIGLFGTVLGVIQAFSALSADQAGSQEVMASIAKALVATAAGLFVAIPAVVAFNYFSSKLRASISRCDALKNLYISRLSQ